MDHYRRNDEHDRRSEEQSPNHVGEPVDPQICTAPRHGDGVGDTHTEEQPVWKISGATFESVLALYGRDQDASDRGVGAG